MQEINKIIVSVTTDLNTDQRVQKVCRSLVKEGYSVELIGRQLSNSKKLSLESYKQHRINLRVQKGVSFYALFNLTLFVKLLFKKADVLYANDLDTLPANYVVSKLKRIPLIYDSHEYFTEVPELQSRQRVKAVWEYIESRIFPNLKYCITVSKRIAESYTDKYGVRVNLIRNFPQRQKVEAKAKKRQIIYQGALNIGRGLEDIINAMPYVENACLQIAGTGDIEKKLKNLRDRLELNDRVHFLGKVEPEELRGITAKSLLGVSLEEDLGLNYRYALPNKVFDYFMAATPVLYSNLVEFKELIKSTSIGEELKSRKPELLARQINEMLDSKSQHEWQSNCLRLAQEFCWENEEKVLFKLLEKIKNEA